MKYENMDHEVSNIPQILEILEIWILCVLQKRRAPKHDEDWSEKMRRDLSYETHLGPKTKTD